MKLSPIAFTCFIVGITIVIQHQITIKLLASYTGGGASWFQNVADKLVLVLALGVFLILFSVVLAVASVVIQKFKNSQLKLKSVHNFS